jgi:hypothetical protein
LDFTIHNLNEIFSWGDGTSPSKDKWLFVIAISFFLSMEQRQQMQGKGYQELEQFHSAKLSI